ncbi:MAG TPA: exodeoxyribonuclease V subunit alpha [Syntrophorhabdaceae bacterium]|nr:exodeoxyribonuclease V subunit alpha [Syntrophorhabdaceae bacterium]
MAERNETGFSGIHRYFADFMVSLSNNLSQDEKRYLWLASALVSYFVEKGHICIDLQGLAGTEHPIDEDDRFKSVRCPDLSLWLDALKKADVVGGPQEKRPLILTDNGRLYLNRYWQYERSFIGGIIRKLNLSTDCIDEASLDKILNRLFPNQHEKEEDMQRKAAKNAATKNFLVISGGPGTGKTFTIVKIIALLLELSNNKLSIALAAPTGKAAQRLKAVIKDARDKIDCPDEIKRHIPEDVLTIHRLLGASYRTRRFRFHEDNPLPYDVIIIDEASMIDLPLMSKFLSAIPIKTRLILVGDKDQLSSVEPGAVFGDICEGAEDIDSSIVILKKNYRFTEDSGIGILSELVKQGRGKDALNILKAGRYEDIIWHHIPSPDILPMVIEKSITDRYSRYIKSTDVEEAFRYFDEFHVLCALRHGPYGVIAVNELIEKDLEKKGLIKITGRWYRGKPVMITVNDYSLKLFNGDTGIVFPDRDNKDMLRVYFKTEDGGLRKVVPARIGDYETAYSITVHKSQGSEFNDIIIILPDRSSEILTRELIYTAITRAKRGIEIWGNEGVFIEAVEKRIERQSGIRDALFSIPRNQG